MPPRLRTLEEEGERHASWLELFFDVVFVVAITQLSHALVVDHSPAGFLRFAGLFLPVFLAWQGYTFYADRFDTDDLLLRVAMFAGMLAIAAMAVLIPDVAHGANSAGFAIAYAVATSGSDWRVDSASAAILGFVVVTAVWWLYFDRQAHVVLRGSSLPAVMIYSYAHLPLLMGLAAMSAGINLAIERAGKDHLGTGAAVALLVVMVFVERTFILSPQISPVTAALSPAGLSEPPVRPLH